MKYRFIDRHRSAFGVERMCHVFAVSRSGFYRWNQDTESKRAIENRNLLGHIGKIYAANKGRYGSPRVTAELQDQGHSCSRPRVARLMRKNGMKAQCRRRFKATTDSKHKYPAAPNLLKPVSRIDALNRIWVSDITYIRTMEGWLYLTVVMDVVTRKIIGWAMSDRMSAGATTIPAFRMALHNCPPLPGLIFHSDQGVQYACDEFVTLLKESKVVQSMSSRGNCYDNAVVESFFHTLKTELVYHVRYSTREEAKRSLFEYIEVFYNRSRRHSYLGYKSPAEYEDLRLRQAI